MKIYANAGADFLYIENEHSMLDPSPYADVALCAHDNGLPVITKAPYLDRGAVVKLLDSGTIGYNVCAKMTIFKKLGHINHGIEN